MTKTWVDISRSKGCSDVSSRRELSDLAIHPEYEMGYYQDPLIETFDCEAGYCDPTGEKKVETCDR